MKQTKTRIKLVSILLGLCLMFIPVIKLEAASAMIQFALSEESVKVGDTITVVMTVEATEGINAIDAYVSYDANMIAYKSGGKYVSGSSGLLRVNASDLAAEKNTVKFSIQFTALTAGNCAVNISDTASVIGGNSDLMSSSSNRLSFTIKAATSDSTGNSITSITQNASSDNNLLSLSVNEIGLEPNFQSDITDYSITVGNEVETLYFSYAASDRGAIVEFQGNEGLRDGVNKAKVVVTAPNQDKKEYKIEITKETAAETEQRLKEQESDINKGIGFQVYKDNGIVYLENKYRFQIVDVEEADLVPAGYRKTSVLLYGTNVTAYTIANDLDNDYLLMYCMNENGDKEFYQFDRQEKSLQRYSGDLVSKVNANADSTQGLSMTEDEYSANLSQMAIVVAILAGVCAMLILAIISITLRQVKAKSKKIEDELDF